MNIKMKNITFVVIASIAILPWFSSCDDDNATDEEKPVISGLEVGHDDTLHVGEGIHLEFEAEDNEALDYYKIEIHPEEGDHEHKSTREHIHWEFDSTFNEISGLKNSTVHHHKIVVPENAELGDYHFHLTLVDKAGNSESIEKEVVVAEEDGDHGHGDHNH